LVEATITAEAEVPIVTIWVDGSDETHESGTTTGDENPVDGITTDDGMKTNDEAGTDETIEDGTVKITDDGTVDGTLVYSTTTNPEVDNEIYWPVESDETTEAGTTTNDDQVDGALTVDGNEMIETAVDGID
jgi:hypothetical protein